MQFFGLLMIFIGLLCFETVKWLFFTMISKRYITIQIMLFTSYVLTLFGMFFNLLVI
jgi:hypothetical protein